MAKIIPMWLNDAMRGRADKTSRTYLKVDRITGRTYAVTLRNPVSGKNFSNAQITANNKFGALAKGVAAWVAFAKSSEATAADKAQLEKFQKAVKSQHLYPTVRILIAGKRYATVSDDLSAVTVKDGQYTKTIQFEFNARPLVGAPAEDFEPAQGGGGGSTGGSSDNSDHSDPSGGSATDTFTIKAAMSGEGGRVVIRKNGSVVEGDSVQATASDTVVIEAVAENGNFEFLGWSDGNTQNPRTIQPSADMDVTASFMNLG